MKIRLGEGNITKKKSIIDKIKPTGYGKYLGALIRKHGLEKDFFLGSLFEEKMIIEYQMANVFICPSSIGNSPNSLEEAQLIGVPVKSSYVGDTLDMIEGHKIGYYIVSWKWRCWPKIFVNFLIIQVLHLSYRKVL